ncbi:hypothetical protein M0R19_06120 [Candidatus Pacearchaeota archaeon]|jgi:vacuolar-type H+-ATPase subunit H|nr:hypothetical protein [Candidatus Pacearchaeota archaeon]
MEKVKIFNQEYEINILDEAKFDETDFTGEATKLPGTFSWYAFLYAKAQWQASKLKSAIELLESKLDMTIRESYETTNKKVTEAKIRQEVIGDETLVELKEKYNEAIYVAEVLRACKDSLLMKRDSMKAYGYSMREEYNNDVKVTR